MTYCGLMDRFLSSVFHSSTRTTEASSLVGLELRAFIALLCLGRAGWWLWWPLFGSSTDASPYGVCHGNWMGRLKRGKCRVRQRTRFKKVDLGAPNHAFAAAERQRLSALSDGC